MTDIQLNKLHAHPDNANRMRDRDLRKLIGHLRATDHCPAIIVRPHPTITGDYQILDGHHRAMALRALDRESAPCDIWNVDDEQSRILLLTLNRLRGEDDPQLRGKLLRQLAQSQGIRRLASQLPETRKRIERLIEASRPAPPVCRPPPAEHTLQGVTFFLTPSQMEALDRALRRVSSNRSVALVSLLKLNGVAP